MNRQDDVIEIDLRKIFLLLSQHLLGIVTATAAGALAAGLISIYLMTPMYTAVSQIYILNNQDAMVSLSDLQMGSSLADDYEELIKSRPVVEEVAERMKLDMSYEELLGYLTVTNKENTRIIRVTVTYKEPSTAKEMADTFAEVSRKRISEIMNLDEPNIVENAVVPKKQSSPNNVRNIFIGGFFAFVLAVGFLVVRDMLDDTIKTTDDVENYLGLNMLAAIPAEGGTDNSEKKKKRKLWGIRKV